MIDHLYGSMCDGRVRSNGAQMMLAEPQNNLGGRPIVDQVTLRVSIAVCTRSPIDGLWI